MARWGSAVSSPSAAASAGSPISCPGPQLPLASRAVTSSERPMRLADLADGAAGAVADDGGADRRPLAAVAVVEVLDHLLAALVLEVDVDVGRLAPAGRDEALEQQVVLGRVDRGDAEHVADRRVGRRAAALAEDAAVPREADDLVHGQEVGRVAELARSAAARGRSARRCRAACRPASARPGPRRPGRPGSPAATARARAPRRGIRSAAGRARSRALASSAARLLASASGWSAKSRAISAAGLRWRSALASAA